MYVEEQKRNYMCETKETKFNKLFKQESFYQLYNTGGALNKLCNLLTEQEIDQLLEKNVVFIRTVSPASQIEVKNLKINGDILLINFNATLFYSILPEEFIAIILHEIGHVFNPENKGMEGEYAADNFANQKGYAKWIVSGLEKGIKSKWIGFEADKCQPRIDKLRNPN